MNIKRIYLDAFRSNEEVPLSLYIDIKGRICFLITVISHNTMDFPDRAPKHFIPFIFCFPKDSLGKVLVYSR